MDNPWKNLQGQFVLRDDHDTLLRDKRFYQDKYKLQLQLPPVPFLNDPETSRLVILAKNPGYSQTNDDDLVRFPELVSQNIAALTFKSDCPLFYLDPRFKGSDGYIWWKQVLGDVLQASRERYGVSQEAVVKGIACVQWYPYHSKRFRQPLETLPSQPYSFDLVKKAATAKREKLFVILWGTRNEHLWRTSVPELPKDCILLNSQQCPRLSRGNMSQEDFDRIINAVCSPYTD